MINNIYNTVKSKLVTISNIINNSNNSNINNKVINYKLSISTNNSLLSSSLLSNSLLSNSLNVNNSSFSDHSLLKFQIKKLSLYNSSSYNHNKSNNPQSWIQKLVNLLKKYYNKLDNYTTNLPGILSNSAALHILIWPNLIIFLFCRMAYANNDLELIKFIKKYMVYNHDKNILTSIISSCTHFDFLHFFMNMWGIYMLSPLLITHIGGLPFLSLFVGSSILSSYIGAINHSDVIGASGGVYGVLGVLVITHNTLPVHLFGILPLTLGRFIYAAAAIDAIQLFYHANTDKRYFGSLGHLTGLLTGLVFAKYLKL